MVMDVSGADGSNKFVAKPKQQEADKQSRWIYASERDPPSGPSQNLPGGAGNVNYGNITTNMNPNYSGPSGAFDSNGPIGSSSSAVSDPGNRPKAPSSQQQQNFTNSPMPEVPQLKPPSMMEYQRPQYTLPGVLHFLQHEWTRLELDRAQWEVERAELQARVAFLQGERKSQESLKVDLVRRIKMLELALRQERQKFVRYKNDMEGGPASTSHQQQPLPEEQRSRFDSEFDHDNCMNDLGYGDYMRESPQSASIAAASGISCKEGRHLLRQYLKEIGYTDTLINVRSARIRAVLGAAGRRVELNNNNSNNQDGESGHAKEVLHHPKDQLLPKSVMDNALLAAENAICATFDFLNPDGLPRSTTDGEGDESDEGDEEEDEEPSSPFTNVFRRDKKSRKTMIPIHRPPKSASNEDMAQVMGDADTEAALKEFDFLASDDGSGEARSLDNEQWHPQANLARMKEEFKNEQKDRRGMHRPKRSQLHEMLSNLKQEEDITDLTTPKYTVSFTTLPEMPFPAGGESATDGSFALGELAALTVNNETESGGYDLSANRSDGGQRKSWTTKYTLRSHFDGVRSLAFHPDELMLMTGSDDGTLKYWNLFRNWNGSKKASSVDFEPVYTFRGHLGPVLSTTMNHNGEYCISGGADSTIRFWNLSCTSGDPYEAYDPQVVGPIMRQHTDAVWHLTHHPTQPFMVSCSADKRLMWWNTEKLAVLMQIGVSDWGAPTSADVFGNDVNRVCASYAHHAAIFDVETGKSVVKFKIPENADDYIYRIVNHPIQSIAITAHEDREVRFFDTNSGELINSMVAHLDAVSSVAVDPNGLYLITGSHDSSVRFWSMDSKTCVQENTAHRKKLDESIYDVAFHRCKSHVASAGADGVAKVYT